MDGGYLIPGLPNELALDCLIRLPYDALPAAHSVSKLWKHHLQSPHFRRRRRSAALALPLVVLVQAEPHPVKCSGYHLVVHEPATGVWSRLRPMPGNGLPLFCRLAAAGEELVVVGGWDPETFATSDAVHVYDFATGAWRTGAAMPRPRRSFFACSAAVVGGRKMVLVAGGHDEDKKALRSAMAYDVSRNEWVTLPCMARERDECRGVILHGKFHVIGGYATEAQGSFSRSAEVFDFATWKWAKEENAPEMDCVAEVGGRLYMCSSGNVVVADEALMWRVLAPLPKKIRVAPEIVGWEGSLMVVGSGRSGWDHSCFVLNLSEAVEELWKKVDMVPEHSGHIRAMCSLEI